MTAPVSIRIKVPTVALQWDKKYLRQTFRRAGAEVAAVARRLITSATGDGTKYGGPGGSAAKYRGGYKRGGYQASSPGAAPVSVTGTLAKSIKVLPFKSGEGVAVRDRAFYALFLEKGAKGGGRIQRGGKRVCGKGGIGQSRVLLPRPFLDTALDQRQASIAARIKAAVLDGIEFRKLKA
jgi:hypothetical protein